MALDPTARESNVRDSLKKYFFDTIETVKGYPVTYDISLTAPRIAGRDCDRWVTIDFGDIEMDSLSSHMIRLFVCSRKDPEARTLLQMRDNIMGYLTDNTQTDGSGRITLYKTNENPWTEIGSMVVVLDPESQVILGADNTKYKIINIQVKWGAAI
jgi:hypothetical protein